MKEEALLKALNFRFKASATSSLRLSNASQHIRAFRHVVANTCSSNGLSHNQFGEQENIMHLHFATERGRERERAERGERDRDAAYTCALIRGVISGK